MMMFISTETLVNQLVNERPRGPECMQPQCRQPDKKSTYII
jgi:hypothetical protein